MTDYTSPKDFNFLEKAEEFLIENDWVSTSFLMRKFGISRILAEKMIKKLSKKRIRFKLLTKDKVNIHER